MNTVNRCSLAVSSAGMFICYQKANNTTIAICMECAVIKIIIVEETVIIFESGPEITCLNSNFTVAATCECFDWSVGLLMLQLWRFCHKSWNILPCRNPSSWQKWSGRISSFLCLLFEASNLLGYTAKLSHVIFQRLKNQNSDKTKFLFPRPKKSSDF